MGGDLEEAIKKAYAACKPISFQDMHFRGHWEGMTGLKIEGVVFDVDGVLFDTERLTQQTWLAVSREMGWPQVGEAYLEFVGQNRADIFQKMEDLFLGRSFPRTHLWRPVPPAPRPGWRRRASL